jgi:hypothetical protein
MGKYDKLIKENLASIIAPLSRRMGIDLERGRIEIIKDKLQFTIEREPDFLFKVCHDDPSEDYVAQFDFQVPNDMEMPDRMLFYRNLVKLVLKLPIRQLVFYMADGPLLMVNYLREPKLYFEYELYDWRTFTANSFLESDIPQEVILAILGNFEGEAPEIMMEKIILRLKTVVKRKKDFEKFSFHLHVLSSLRKLQRIYQQKIRTMPISFDIDFEIDPFYIEGVEKGEKNTKTLMVQKLLLERRRTVKYIAELVEVAEAFVLSIQKTLIQEGKLLNHTKK